MNSPSSPKFKNLKCNTKSSPVEIKERMRKNYKDKIQNCRDLLLNRFRGTVIGEDLRSTLSEIYKSMFNFSDKNTILDDEELVILNDIKKEFIEEELEWLMVEYEKSQTDNIDWATVEDDNVICPVCQKTNCLFENNVMSCSNCKYSIKTLMTLKQIKQHIFRLIEKHSLTCDKECQFTLLSEESETHLFLICDVCTDMQIVA